MVKKQLQKYTHYDCRFLNQFTLINQKIFIYLLKIISIGLKKFYFLSVLFPDKAYITYVNEKNSKIYF